ncbi:unnamed protein product, partial [Amoebophrya sp. A25]
DDSLDPIESGLAAAPRPLHDGARGSSTTPTAVFGGSSPTRAAFQEKGEEILNAIESESKTDASHDPHIPKSSSVTPVVGGARPSSSASTPAAPAPSAVETTSASASTDHHRLLQEHQ